MRAPAIMRGKATLLILVNHWRFGSSFLNFPLLRSTKVRLRELCAKRYSPSERPQQISAPCSKRSNISSNWKQLPSWNGVNGKSGYFDRQRQLKEIYCTLNFKVFQLKPCKYWLYSIVSMWKSEFSELYFWEFLRIKWSTRSSPRVSARN